MYELRYVTILKTYRNIVARQGIKAYQKQRHMTKNIGPLISLGLIPEIFIILVAIHCMEKKL
jgi:hypothetical protein